MSFLNSKTKIVNKTPIPATVDRKDAVALLHDHEFFILCDPHHSSHKVIPSTPSPSIPSTIIPLNPIQTYEVIDHMPNPVWSSTVISREEFVNHEAGIWVRIRSPMGVVMETLWSVIENKEGGLELVEDVVIDCSRLLLGIVKGQVEGNWRGIHGKIVGRLVEGVGKGGE